jgi:ribosome maturation factor RimP
LDRTILDRIFSTMQTQTPPAIASVGIEFLDIEWVGSQRIFRVYIDREGGVTHDDCILVSRWVDETLGLDDAIPQDYRLEVSSPGLDRPLRTLAHFAAHIGQQVQVTLTDPTLERRKAQGSIHSVNGETKEITLDLGDGPWIFPVSKLLKARLLSETAPKFSEGLSTDAKDMPAKKTTTKQEKSLLGKKPKTDVIA